MTLGAALAGMIGGFLGLGGGIILVPLLALGFKLPMHQAVALSLATIMANSIVSSTRYLEKGLVDYRLVILLSIFASIGAIFGSFMGPYIPARYLQIAFSLMMAYTVYSLLKKKDDGVAHRKIGHQPHFLPVILIAFLAGIISSLLGVGGGVLIVPAAYLIFNYSLDVSRGTSAYTIGIIATAGSVVYFARGTLNVEYAGQIMLGTMAGGWLGSWLGLKAKLKVVKWFFAIVLIYTAVKMFLEGIK